MAEDHVVAKPYRSPKPEARSLFAVRDPVDRSGLIVGNEERAVGCDEHVYGSAPCAPVRLEPTLGEVLEPPLALFAGARDDDAIADRLAAIPRPVLGDGDLVAIRVGKHSAHVESHAERGDMGAETDLRSRVLRAVMSGPKLRVHDVLVVAVWKAEVHARPRRVIELVIGNVVAHPVPPVVGEPELL